MILSFMRLPMRIPMGTELSTEMISTITDSSMSECYVPFGSSINLVSDIYKYKLVENVNGKIIERYFISFSNGSWDIRQKDPNIIPVYIRIIEWDSTGEIMVTPVLFKAGILEVLSLYGNYKKNQYHPLFVHEIVFDIITRDLRDMSQTDISSNTDFLINYLNKFCIDENPFYQRCGNNPEIFVEADMSGVFHELSGYTPSNNRIKHKPSVDNLIEWKRNELIDEWSTVLYNGIASNDIKDMTKGYLTPSFGTIDPRSIDMLSDINSSGDSGSDILKKRNSKIIKHLELPSYELTELKEYQADFSSHIKQCAEIYITFQSSPVTDLDVEYHSNAPFTAKVNHIWCRYHELHPNQVNSMLNTLGTYVWNFAQRVLSSICTLKSARIRKTFTDEITITITTIDDKKYTFFIDQVIQSVLTTSLSS